MTDNERMPKPKRQQGQKRRSKGTPDEIQGGVRPMDDPTRGRQGDKFEQQLSRTEGEHSDRGETGEPEPDR